MRTSFVEKLRNREKLFGTIVSIASPVVAEVCALAGVDWLFIDMEHGVLELGDVARIVQAVDHQCPVVVRVPAAEESWIKRVLDIGVSGVIIPQVKSAAEAKRIISWCKYSPLGTRSVGIARAQGYGSKLKEYLETANNSVAVILLIEHIDAIEDIKAIGRLAGLDALFLGPYDLSASLGVPGQIDDPAVTQAIQKFKQSCEDSKIPFGIFAPGNSLAKRAAAEGYSLIAVGIDAPLLMDSVKAAIGGIDL